MLANWCLLQVIGVVIDFWSIWYSISVMIIYLNDSFYDMFWSQLYFSITEVFVFICAVSMSHSHKALPQYLIDAALGTSLFHIVQLCTDEKLLFFGDQIFITMVRNVALISSDVLFSVAFWKIGRGQKKNAFVVTVLHLMFFQLAFADYASFKLSS
jgi:hypothetical protein